MGIAERWRGLPPLPDDIERRVSELPKTLARTGVRLAYLFGSLARGDAGDDVDLAILTGRDSVLDVWDEIVRALGTDRVDLVDLTQASPVLRFAIVREGRLLFAADDDQEREFELAAVRDYRDTDHHRAIHNSYLGGRAPG